MNEDNNGMRYKSDIDINNKEDVHVVEFEYIDENKNVLDVGCACGDFGVILKKYKNSNVYGIERDKKAIDIAMKTESYMEIIHIDLDGLQNDDLLAYKNKFDYIVCGDILEHLQNPMEILSILKMCLNEGGYIIASIPNIAHTSIKANLLVDDFTYTQIGLLDETHIRFFTYKTIADNLANFGFKICSCSFTLQHINGYQPNDPYCELSGDIKKFLFEDWHSFVCQYVVKIQPSEELKHELYENNINIIDINENNAPYYIKSYREYVLSTIGDTCENKIFRISCEYEQKMVNMSNYYEQRIIDYENKIIRKKKKYKTIAAVLCCFCFLEMLWIILKGYI